MMATAMMRGRSAAAVTVVMMMMMAAVEVCSGNYVMEVKHIYGGRGGRSLSALKAHDQQRHARFLSAVSISLPDEGITHTKSLYLAKIGIGTPPKDYFVQVDTGSDILWVNCAGCDTCPTKSDLGIKLTQYDLKASSTGELVTCDHDFCSTVFSSPRPDCKVGMPCHFSVTYGDGSSTAGYFVEDTVQLDRVSGDFQTDFMNGTVSFGCGAKNSGQLGTSSDAVDGILGFGQSNSSMISQLAAAGKVKRIFSHCLDSTNGGGIFAIGEVVEPKIKTTPLVPNMPHYNAYMKAVEVGGDVLQLPTDAFDNSDGKGTIIDSGTTLAYLSREIYEPVMKNVFAPHPDITFHTVEEQFKCFEFSGNVDDGFQPVTFHFQNSVSLTVYPHDYLFQIKDDEWCVGWQSSRLQSDDGKQLTLLGDLALSNKVVMYDLINQTIGWAEYNCSAGIKVRDDQSGAVHLVKSHDISSGSNLNVGRMSTLLSLVAVLLYSIF